MNDNILVVDRLKKSYGKFTLEDVTFKIPRGYIMGFVGQNGAGKSTTIKCIMNLIEYDAGKIEVFGLDNRKHSVEIKDRIGYVSEEQYFYEEMSVEWTGRFVGSFYRTWDESYFNKLLDQFGVDKRKKIKELSKGMKMKLSLALAMAHRPELLILDEPTSGLDPVVRSELLEMFLDIIQDEKCSIFFSSHITSDIEKVADYITVINKGKLVITDERDSILERWKVIKAENHYLNSEIGRHLRGIKKGDFGFSGITDRFDEFSAAFRRIYPQGSFKSEKITLDELLVRISKEGEEAC